MELYLIGIGNIACLELWERDLRAVKLPCDYIDEKGKKHKTLMRLGVNKIQPYRLTFPEPQLDVVMSLIGVGTDGSYVLKRFPKLKKIVLWGRKLMGMTEPPMPKKVIQHMQPDASEKAVAIIPIGLKKDIYNKQGTELI